MIRGRAAHAAQTLATFVPRFYGRTDAEIFAASVSEADAQLAVARTQLFSNWDALVAAGEEKRPDFNQRVAVIDALLATGFPIDYDCWGSTLLQWAQGNQKNVLGDHLLKRGARRGK